VASLPANQQGRYDTTIAAQWAQSDPAGAAAWAAQTDAALVANALERPVRPASWRARARQFPGHCRINLVLGRFGSFGQFLQSLADSPDKDQACGVCLNASSVDPATAMQWADSITNPRLQATHRRKRLRP